MRLHRFFITESIELSHDFWLKDKELLWQWQKVLRYQPGQEVVLFNGIGEDKLYRIDRIEQDAIKLTMLTEFVVKKPTREVTLFWSVLKKDKNDWVLQKATELGVSHFVPLLSDRSEKTGLHVERAQKIIIEASEQCGRSDIPSIREPITLLAAIKEYKQSVKLFVCEQGNQKHELENAETAVGVLIGPEGGWSDEERAIFAENDFSHIGLSDFTLRAETACVVASHVMLQLS
jgi:16S rRNA (uracil1498-N3)-methyltransferase